MLLAAALLLLPAERAKAAPLLNKQTPIPDRIFVLVTSDTVSAGSTMNVTVAGQDHSRVLFMLTEAGFWLRKREANLTERTGSVLRCAGTTLVPMYVPHQNKRPEPWQGLLTLIRCQADNTLMVAD
jgi:hypothetical protein